MKLMDQRHSIRLVNAKHVQTDKHSKPNISQENRDGQYNNT